MYDNEFFVVDMASCTSTGEIVNSLSLALETLNHSGKKIVLKLNDSSLNQSQLLSIQSLITSYGCILDTIETINPQTASVAENMNILVQKPIEKRVEEIGGLAEDKKADFQPFSINTEPNKSEVIALKDVNGLHFEADLDAIKTRQQSINIGSDLKNAGINPKEDFETIEKQVISQYQKPEDVVKTNPRIKVFFSSPFTSNPEILLENVINNSKKCKVNTQFVAVNQNLLYVVQVPRKIKEWQIQLCTIEKNILLGYVIMADRPTSERHKVVHIAYQTLNRGGCLIYSNGAADAENTASLLFNLLPEHNVDAEVEELIELVKKTIHAQYVLARVLSKGIAFHYGNMPLLIRSEIERLFSVGKIEYLICTSTLLEGVNLPAKSIIIRKPSRGKGNPLNQNDFWNLAGRAGRLGKEYSGNIFCIEPSKWDIQPEPNKTKQEIKRALNIVESKGDELLDYIRRGAPRREAVDRPDLDAAFGYFYIRYVLEKEKALSTPFYDRLLQELQVVQSQVTLPSSIVKKNPGISPLAQQSLYDYFTEHIDVIDTLIPVYPNDSNAFEEYKSLVEIIGQTISYYPQQLNASRAILLINWMSGRPLSYLISKSYDSYMRKHYHKKLSEVIREVMDNVESYVRYQFAKDSSCYVDILR